MSDTYSNLADPGNWPSPEQQAVGNVFAGNNHSADDAARAFELAKATGNPYGVVYDNLENFERDTRNRIGASIVRGNPHLQEYVNSHPLAAKVSNDDYGQLDAASQAMQKLAGFGPIGAAVKGFQEGFDYQGMLEEERKLYEYVDHPVWRFLTRYGPIGAAAVGLEGSQRLFTGLVQGAAAGIGSASTQLTGSEAWGNRLTRDLIVLAQVGMSGQGGYGLHPEIHAQINKWAEVSRAAEHHLKAGEEPPTGLHQDIDKGKIDDSKQAADALSDALKESQASTTRERAPDLYANFVRQHVGEARIGISADAIRELYGNKLPSPDDGILGFVPDLADQLEVASHTGADIQIPMADWLAKVEPDVAKELGDFIRVRPGGVSKFEAEQIKASKPEVVPNNPTDAIRQSAKLEPLFGQRKLTLQRKVEAVEPITGEAPAHQFEMLDPQGTKVGDLFIAEEADGKRLYVDDIEGLDRANAANTLGPAAMRDVLRQLKHEFPKAEELTGFRVSGARDKAGTWETKGKVTIKLSTATDAELQKFFAPGPGEFQEVGGGYSARFIPEDSLLANERAIIDELNVEMAKLGAMDVDVHVPAEIVGKEAAGIRGLYLPGDAGLRPLILVSMRAPDRVGTLRHEFMHDLLGRKFFTNDERSILERAAREGDWIKKHDIKGRYPDLGVKDWLEEAIADEFGRFERGEAKPQGALAKVWEKYQALLDAVRRVIRKVTGKTNWEDLFREAAEGRIAERGPEAAAAVAKEARGPKEPELPGITRMEDRPPFEGSFPDWMPKPIRERLLKLIERRQKEDYEALSKKYERDAAKRTTAEWKSNEKIMRGVVAQDLAARPDFAADAKFQDGTIKISPEGLTPEQRAALPKGYLSADGISADEVAGAFGYHSGSAMVDALGQLETIRKQAGMKPEPYFERVVDIETEQRMLAKYGETGEEALREAREQAHSETQEELLHEQTLALALGSNQEFPLTRQMIRQKAQEAFAKTKLHSTDVATFERTAGRAGALLRDAAVKEDWAEAFRQSQRQYIAQLFAKEAVKLAKERAAFDRIAQRFSKRYPDNFPPEYTEAIQEILMKLGETVRRTWLDLQKEQQARSEPSLKEFVDLRNRHGLVDGTVIPVPEWIMDPGFRGETANLSVDEFREMKAGLDALYKHGRDEGKFLRGQEKEDLANWVTDRTQQLAQKFPVQRGQYSPTRYNRFKQTIREYIAAITNMETFFGRLDNRDPHGEFTRTIVFPAAEAANHKAALDREFHEVYRDLEKLKNPDGLVEPPFLDPKTGQLPLRFTRRNLEAVIANIGNEGNFRALHEGFDVDPDVLLAWIEKNTTAEDIDRAQRRGDMSARAWEMYKNVERNVNGYASKDITNLRPFTMHGKEYKGWYYPIIDDPDRSPATHLIGDPEREATNFWPSVPTGFAKERKIGAKHVLDLNIDMFPIKLNQVLHSVAFKAFVNNTAKIFKNRAFRDGISKYYGKEYVDEMDVWIKDIAGNASYDSRLSGKIDRLSNFFRQNVISNYIAFNPYTIQKHGLSAFVMSAKEIGPINQLVSTAQVFGPHFFYHAVADLFTKDPYLGNTLWKFIWDNSEEIQRRSRNWKETVVGAHDITYSKSSWRKTLAEWGSQGVAMSDMLSAAPLWLGVYREAFDELGEHGPAVEEANRAVRRAHGSTAITNVPRFVRRSGPLGSWMTSVYGFFGTMMQRRIEIAHDISDAYRLAMDGEIKQAAKAIPGITTSMMAYVVWPVMVEEMVTGQFTDDKRGLGTKLAWASIRAATDTFLYLRDLEFGLEHGREPGAGLAQGPIGDTTRLFRELTKKRAFSKENAGKMVQDLITVIGDFTGLTTKAMGSLARYGIDTATGKQKPRTIGDVLRGVTRGDIKQRIER